MFQLNIRPPGVHRKTDETLGINNPISFFLGGHLEACPYLTLHFAQWVFFFFFHIGDIASMDYRQRLQSISAVSTAAVTCVYGRNHFLRMTWALVVLCIKGSNTTSSLVNATILWSSIIFLPLAAGVNTSIHQVGAALAPPWDSIWRENYKNIHSRVTSSISI